ncbi:MAG: histidine triad nucleotide-binding protein [Dehalococcoidia bacterium]|nr:histidine triad nucleotide-binding protein [Dehalococcoidia bacterium]
MPCIFCKIASGGTSTEFLYQDEEILAFRDINPLAPTHILIVPRKHIASVNDLQDDNFLMLGKMIGIARDIAKTEGIADSGYRLVINTGHDGGQRVPHLHLHLMGGRRLADRVDWRR